MTQRVVRLPRSELPRDGAINVVKAGGRRIGLMWVGDELHAIADRCPHRGAPLCSAGELVARMEVDGGAVRVASRPSILRCPWHRWDFDVASGRCREAPRLQVRRYAVTVADDAILIDLGPVRDSTGGPGGVPRSRT